MTPFQQALALGSASFVAGGIVLPIIAETAHAYYGRFGA
jgi:hypothetical protein